MAFLLQPQEASCLQILILIRDFSQLDVCLNSNREGLRNPGEFWSGQILLHCELDKSTRKEPLLNRVLISAEELIKEVKDCESLCK